MKSFFGSFLGALIGMILVGVIAIIAIIALIISFTDNLTQNFHSQEAELHKNVILELRLNGEITDQPTSRIQFLNESPLSIIEIVQALEKAKTDPYVKGLLIRADNDISLSIVKPIQLALHNFKSSGKPVVFFTANLFEHPSITPYWLASQANEIWTQNRTFFMTTGISKSVPFYASLMEKIGAEAQLEQYKEYKNAANTFTENHLTKPHKEAMLSLLDNLWEQILADISKGRNLPYSETETLIKSVPHTAEKAQELGLIDGLGFYIDLKEKFLNNIQTLSSDHDTNNADSSPNENNTKFISLKKYYNIAKKPYQSGSVIAFIYGQGPITSQNMNNTSPLGMFEDNKSIYGYAMANAINEAMLDKDVKAIILRLDTPGGEVTPSEEILHAISQAQKQKKPVIVSMGSVTASGGYYIASRADRIIALPSTITGSIGVLGGKIFIGKTAEKLGIDVETLQVGGKLASTFSPFEKFTPEEKTVFKSFLKNIYDNFILHVSEGRNLSIEQTEEIAKGRVWTGEQALKLGLVDELGGLNKAIEVAKELAGIDQNLSITLKKFPERLSETELFLNLLKGNVSKGIYSVKTLSEILESPQIGQIIDLNREIQKKHNASLYYPYGDKLVKE